MDTTISPLALVTGANRGLGYATAQRLGDLGATVLVAARASEKAHRATADLRAAGIWAYAVTLDVTSAASVASAAAHVDATYGRLDILVNNAGVLPEAFASEACQPLDLRLFETAYATNVYGAVSVTQAFLPLLHRSDAGRIINVSSTMGSLTEQLNPESPYFGMVLPAYQSSKAALNAVTVACRRRSPTRRSRSTPCAQAGCRPTSVGRRTGPRHQPWPQTPPRSRQRSDSWTPTGLRAPSSIGTGWSPGNA